MQTSATITLNTPIKRKDQEITALTLRKPMSGELRGCSLMDLTQMEVGALVKVLPRITDPSITDQEAARLDPADLLVLGVETVSFLLPKQALQEASQQ